MNEWLYERIDGWMVGWIVGWMDEWKFELIIGGCLQDYSAIGCIYPSMCEVVNEVGSSWANMTLFPGFAHDLPWSHSSI